MFVDLIGPALGHPHVCTPPYQHWLRYRYINFSTFTVEIVNIPGDVYDPYIYDILEVLGPYGPRLLVGGHLGLLDFVL